MPRIPRLDFPGARHHVMNRGARRAPIFEEPHAKELFLGALGELPGRFAVQVHGYAIMPNHYHLLIATERGNLSRAMRHLGATFTQRLNTRHGWDGPVFRGRYKNRLVGDDRYWLHLLAYVHLNPVPSLVARPEEWPWSSHRAYQGLEPTPEWLTTATYLRDFGSRHGLLSYVEEHRMGRGTRPAGWSEAALWTPTTSDIVTTELPVNWDPVAATRALDEVAAATGTPLDKLLQSRRGRCDNRARWVAAWWLGRRSELNQRQVARYFDARASGVGNMLFRLRRILEGPEADEEVLGWMAALEEVLKTETGVAEKR